MIFETKKVRIETLSEYLAATRKALDLSLSEVADQAGIAEKFLQNLESGQLQDLPPDVYVFGFIKKLAVLYGAPVGQLLDQYKKERGIVDRVASKMTDKEKGLSGYLSRLIITPKLLTLVVGLGAVVVTVVYLTASVAAIDKQPSLEIFEPTNGSIAKDASIHVSGRTDPGNMVTINDQNTFVDTNGNFNVTLGAVAGQKALEIKAKNKFDKETTTQVVMTVDPTASDAASAAAAPLTLQLKYLRDVSLTLTIDDQVQAQKQVSAGSSETVTGKDKIVVQTADAGAVQAVFNGDNLGSLGRAKETLVVPFTSNH